MESFADTVQMKIARITPCTGDKQVHASLNDFKYAWKRENDPGYGYYHREVVPTIAQLYEFAMKKIQESREADLKIHTANGPGLVINRIIVENICTMMKQIGMPENFKERDHKSRARVAKYNSFQAGYITDIQREIIRNDSYESNVKKYDEYEKYYKEQLEKHLKEAEVEQRKKDQEEQKKKDERKANIEIASLIVKYGLPEDSDWLDIYENLRGKDKYLDLAVAMLSVRNDWNDGPDQVENALGRFHIQTDEDEKIEKCIGSLLENWDSDGRVFRDCEYNYDFLFAKVDPQLFKDYELADKRANPEGY